MSTGEIKEATEFSLVFQTTSEWRTKEDWEIIDRLRERGMVDFRKEINHAYQLVLGRNVDEEGYTRYNVALNDQIITLAYLVNILMHSKERAEMDLRSEPTPGPTTDSKDYVNMQRVPNVIKDLADDLHIWSGVRDPRYVLTYCRGKIHAVFGILPEEMEEISNDYESMYYQGQQLIYDLQEEHKDHPGRSRVCKSVLNAFLAWMEPLNETVGGWRYMLKGQPGHGRYDSIRGWCQYMNSLN